MYVKFSTRRAVVTLAFLSAKIMLISQEREDDKKGKIDHSRCMKLRNRARKTRIKVNKQSN
jgi:hypothetical protein